MNLPKFHETFVPILKVLSNGETLHYNELRKRVRDDFYSDLSKQDLTKKTKSGDVVILNRIGWGKSFLKQAKLIDYPERAMVKITVKGIDALKKGKLTLQDLKKDPDYIAYQEVKRAEKESENDDVEADIDNSSPQDLIDTGISRIEAQVKNELLEKLKEIDPYYFEKVILILLKKMGYGDIIETSKSGDGGIDGIINQDQLGLEKIYIQAKRYNETKVREKEIRNFIGAMSSDTSKGLFVTTSTYDDSAIKKARDAHHHTIILIDGIKLVNLMYQHSVGLQVRSTYEVKGVDEDFFIEN